MFVIYRKLAKVAVILQIQGLQLAYGFCCRRQIGYGKRKTEHISISRSLNL